MATSNKFKYWPHLIILILATIADVIALIFVWDGGTAVFFATFIFLGIFLLWPTLALLAGLIYVIAETRKPVNLLEKVFLSWTITLLLSLPLTMVLGRIYNDYARIYHTLPNNDTMTIWQDKIIFEKYTSIFPPHSNYIELPKGLSSWKLTIDTAGRSAIIDVNPAEIKQFSPKYPLVAIYKGDPGYYWSRTEFPPEKWLVHVEFDFYRDAFSTGGCLKYTTIANDSVYHVHGDYPFTQYSQYKESPGKVEPLDSFLISFHKQTHYYRHWADSTQYSAFYKTK